MIGEGAHVLITDTEYSHRGRRLVGQLAVDDSRIGARPAVLVCHEGNGLSEHSKRVAERLAELGYVAFALDYYGDGAVLAPEDMPDRFAEISSDPELTRGIAAAGLAELLASEYNAGVDWQLRLLGGNVHSFTNPAVDALANPALRYDAAAEARAWRAALGLLDEVF